MSYELQPNSSLDRTVYYTSKDWDITEYQNYPCVTHHHQQADGYRYVTPPGHFNRGFQCYGCKQKAPDEVITVWVLLNWDKLEWSEIQ